MNESDKFNEVEALVGELPKLVEKDPICCIYFLIRSHRSEGTKRFDLARYLVMDE